MLNLPFKENYVKTQKFNDKCCRAAYSKFGLSGHNGWDFGCPVGTKLYAPHSGEVTEAAFDQYGYGWYVRIDNEEEFSVLAHFKEKPVVAIGDEVKAGETLIGYSGNTGNSTGPHLHWGYGRNPRDRENGFNGYIDQTHWMDELVGDCVEVEKELDEMRESRNKWRTDYNVLKGNYNLAIEDRDNLGGQLIDLQKKYTDDLQAVTKERDALQEALSQKLSWVSWIDFLIAKLRKG